MKPPIKNYVRFRTFPVAKSNFLQKGIHLDLEIVEKTVFKQRDRHFHINNSRDNIKCHTYLQMPPLLLLISSKVGGLSIEIADCVKHSCILVTATQGL